MAAPCGCGGSAITVEGEAPIEVTRSGVRPVVYTVRLMDGWGSSLCWGPGLVWDEGTQCAQVKLSNDAQNATRFGTDQGVFTPGGEGPRPELCAQTIADLPAAPNVIGAKSLAGLMNPYSSPYGVDYCLANGLDIVHFQVATNADDVGVVADYWDDKITDGRTSIFITQDIRQLDTGTCQSAYNYAGNVDDPVPHQPDADLPDHTGDAFRGDRGGGWWGWLAQRYHQPLAEDFLRKIAAKSIALLSVTPQPDNSFGSEATHLRGAIRAVLGQCAQTWAMIGVAEIANATTVINAGITPVLFAPEGPNPPATWAVADLPFPVADVTGAGIEWMALSDHYANSVFQAYQAAGINVLMIGNSRQSQATRVTDLGIRGALVLDPVYFKQFRDGFGYRSASDPWEHRRPSVGLLTFRTDQQEVISSAGLVRGRTERAEQGLIIPANFGAGLGRPSLLVWEGPVTDPTDYTITWDMKWNTLATASATNAKMGLLVGAATDEDTYDWPDDAEQNPRGYPEGQKTLYRIFQRQNGQIGIAKWPSQTGAIQYLAVTTSPAIAADVWNSYTLRVTPTQLTFTRTVSSGQQYSAVAADTQYRGPYFFVEKEESFNGQAANPFEGKVRNLIYAEGGAA